MGDVGANWKIKAWLAISFDGGGVPSIAGQSGDFDAASLVDNGAGDISIKFLAGNGLKAATYGVSFNVRGALAASQLTTFGIADTSDVEKRITVLREGAAGAVSALTDVNFQCTFFEPGLL